MKTYKTYAECKLANPDCEVYESGRIRSEFKSDNVFGDTSWKVSNPSDHLMTVEKFLDDGHKFVDGDVFLGVNGKVIKVTIRDLNLLAIKNNGNKDRYILKSAALEASRHPHHDLIIEWAKDTSKQVQRKHKVSGQWFNDPYPPWNAEHEYRLKPQQEYIKGHWYPCIYEGMEGVVKCIGGDAFTTNTLFISKFKFSEMEWVGESLGEIKFGYFDV